MTTYPDLSMEEIHREAAAMVNELTKGLQEQFGQAKPEVSLAQVHAPHNITIGGKAFQGGQFIPGEDIAKATPEERKELLGAEHIRKADDTGEIISHMGKGADSGERDEQGTPKVDYKAVTFKGDKGFDEKVHAYLSRHINEAEDSYIAQMNGAVLGLEAEEIDAEAFVKKSATARDEAEYQVSEHVENYVNAISAHMKSRWTEAFTDARKAAFSARIEKAKDDLVSQAYAIHDDLEDMATEGTLDFDAWTDEIGDIADERQKLTEEMKDATDDLEQELQNEHDERESAEEKLRDEIEESHFDDLRGEVADELAADSTQEEVDKAWDEAVNRYNSMLGDGPNPYRISIDSQGELEVVHADDLPDEHKPSVKLSQIEPLTEAETEPGPPHTHHDADSATLDAIIARGLPAGIALAKETRRRVLEAVKKKFG